MIVADEFQYELRYLTHSIFSTKSVTKVATNLEFYQCGKSAQGIKEMKACDLNVLGIGEIIWRDQVNLTALSFEDSKYHVKGGRPVLH